MMAEQSTAAQTVNLQIDLVFLAFWGYITLAFLLGDYHQLVKYHQHRDKNILGSCCALSSSAFLLHK